MKRVWQRKLNRIQLLTSILLVVCFIGGLYAVSNKLCDKVYAIDYTIEDTIGESVSDNFVVATDTLDSDKVYEVTVANDSITMTMDYGYNHYAKYGRYMSVSASVSNEGEDFTGWLQVIAPKDEDNVVYRKEVKVASHNSERITVTLPLVDDTGLLQVKLVDEDKNTVLETNNKIKIGNYENQVYIGVLSNDADKLQYLNNIGTKVFYLNESNLSDDYTGLDLLDVLVINRYDTNRLKKAQLEAIRQWVNRGGTLVIGTGDDYEDTLAELSDTYHIKSTNNTKDVILGTQEEILQELKQKILNYNEQRKFMLETIKSRNDMLAANGRQLIEIENVLNDQTANDRINQLKIEIVQKTIADVKLIGGSSKTLLQKNYLLQVHPMGSGMVQLYCFDLGFEQDNNTIGLTIVDAITKNMSITKQEQLRDEYYGSYSNYDIFQGMTFSDSVKVPKVFGYVIILFIYIILVGPVTFLILKKLDKRSLIWITVPVLAFVFTIIVYILGSGTRIEQPFASYVELLTFQDQNTVEDEVYLGLTAPYNYNYSVEVSSDYDVSSITRSQYNTYMYNTQFTKDIDYDNYMTSINMGLNKTILEVNNNPAFSPVYYQSKRAYAGENNLTAEIQYTGSYISGSVTNGFDYDISNAMLLSDGYIVNIGSMEAGKTVYLDEKESVFLMIRDIYFNRDIINRIAGGTSKAEDNNSETNRKANILYYLGENSLLDSQTSYIVGFLEEDPQGNEENILSDTLIDELSGEVDCYGTRVVLFPVQVNHEKDNKMLVPSMETYIKASESYNNIFYSYHVMNDSEQTIEYHLPADDKILSFEYLSDRNQKYDKDYVKSFEGKIYFLNHKTGNFDEVFRGGVGSSLTEISNYVTDQNTITIRYSTDITLQTSQMLFPYISYWKEAEADAVN